VGKSGLLLGEALRSTLGDALGAALGVELGLPLGQHWDAGTCTRSSARVNIGKHWAHHGQALGTTPGRCTRSYWAKH
jgi:hypothetical protein